jgi:hypothetical protein
MGDTRTNWHWLHRVIEDFHDGFGEVEAPDQGPGLQAVSLPPEDPDQVAKAYKSYRDSGGAPIATWEAERRIQVGRE